MQGLDDNLRGPGASGAPRRCSIQVDFDGTVTLEDSTDALLERFGMEGWERLEDDWREGKIGSRECMSGQVALLDVSLEELDAFVAGIAIDPAFPDFVEAAVRLGCALSIGSDGIDHVIRAVLSRHGLGHLPFRANHLVQVAARRWRLESPYTRPECASGTCKCARTDAARAVGERVIVVGDGASDHCVSARADLVLAKAGLIEHCRSQGIRHLPIGGFSDAIRLLPYVIHDQRDAEPTCHPGS